MLVAACTKMTMSAAEEERCRVLLAKLKEAIDKRGVLLDKLGKVMDETVSSLASSTPLLVCGAADSTPNSTATNKVPAMANAAPSANTTLTDQAPPRCSTMCPDHSIDMPLSDCTTAVAPTSSSTIATLEIGNTFIANTVLVKSTECSKECEEQAVDTDHCVAAAGICAVASTNCLMECPRLVAGDSGVTNLIIVGSVTRIMGLQLKPPWPPPQGPETVLKLFHKQAQNIMMKISGEPRRLRTLSVCLSNASTGQPFISTLEFRQFNGSLYYTTDEAQFFLTRSSKINFGVESNESVRYPDDPFDRIWEPDSVRRANYLVDVMEIYKYVQITRGSQDANIMASSVPFNFESGGSIHSLPKLRLNPYSWSKVSSVIYLHSPAGVGLSYSKNVSDYQTGDLKTAADSHTFLLKWFQRYPEFLSNPFYIAGESYAGVYVPTLSHEVVKGIQGGIKPTINFKGYMVGNGVCDTVFDGNALVPFAHGMGLISDDIYQEAGTACQGNYWNASTAKCEKALSKVDTEINELNIHDILEPCYHSTNIKVIPHKRLISMYVDSVTITNARRVFDGIKYKDIITWNSVISAFAQLGDLHQVLNLLSLMTEEMDPDDFTFAIVLAASANSATVQLRYAYAINVMDISGMLLSQAANSDPECANDILGAVLAACGRNVYELLSDFDWYVSLLTDRARSLHCAQGNEIGRQLVDVGLRVQDAQPELVHSARTLLIDPTLLGKLCPVLYAAAWVYGEYVNFIKDPVELVEALLQPRTSLLPMSVRAVYIQAVPKVITFCCALYVKRLNDSNKEVDVVFDGLVIDQTVSRGSDVAIGKEQIVMPSTVEKDPFSHKLIVYMIELIERTVGPLVECNEVEVLERARNLIGLVHLLREIQELKERNVGDDDKHSRVKDYVKNMQTVFSQELGPVSANAPVILSSTLSECDFPNPALYCEQGDMDSRGSESMKQNMVSENLVQQKHGGDWVLVRLSRNVLLVP